jgi:hypothetical protein
VISSIINIFLVAQIGAVCALFSYFLDYTFWPGSIFKGYLPLLGRILLPKSECDEVRMLSKELRSQAYVDRAENYMLFKLLGGCVFCFNVWITFISFYFLPFEWYYIFVYTTLSHFVLRKIVD